MEQKIIAAIERLACIFRVLLRDIAKKARLSPTRIQFLIYLNNHSEKFCRVSQLAREFGLTKATVSSAISALKKKKLIYKKIWHDDSRVFSLRLTPSGKKLTKKLSNWADDIITPLKQFSPEVKESAMMFLMELIDSLQDTRIISAVRMCITCGNFQRNIHPKSHRPHHCRLRDKAISNSDLNIDCERHNQVFRRIT